MTQEGTGPPAGSATAATPETVASSPAAKAPDELALPALGREVRDGKFAFKFTRVQRGVSSVGGQFEEEAQGAFTKDAGLALPTTVLLTVATLLAFLAIPLRSQSLD